LNTNDNQTAALAGVRVIDAATLFAGPLAATMLGDYGADVLKVEHPDGDPIRRYGAQSEGVSLWWKVLARNKRNATLNLSTAAGQQLFRTLVAEADVVIENFRPGTFERWGLDYATLAAINPRLILARVTGFGQFGPYAGRPGFGTMAEAMSGLAAISGEADGPPQLPAFPLGDAVTGITTAFAIMTALRAREQSGRGQVIDIAIIEAMLASMGAQVTCFDQSGQLPQRHGNRSHNNAPRNVYRCGDGAWVALSAPTHAVAERVMALVGRPDLAAQPWFASGTGRAAHADALDAPINAWAARLGRADVLAQAEQAGVAAAPIYDMADVCADPQYKALGSIVALADPELGTLRTHNVPFRLSDNPGRIRWLGRPKGADNDAVFGALGLQPAALATLQQQGVI
jgi:crotonobetainyl-CoA:carnitine CoA-transferase CaiB-like acyl-CoA transferase